MRLLASTDYALRLLMLLGRQETERSMKVEDIAANLGGLSRNHLHKIVQDLAAMGVVSTVRGAGGGVRLARRPESVKLGWLVRELEADQALVECFRADGGSCAIDRGCRLRNMLREAHEAFYATLDRYTLADCAAGRWFAALTKQIKQDREDTHA